MNEFSLHTDLLNMLVFGSYLFQAFQLVFLPVPSSLSTTGMVSKRFGITVGPAVANQTVGGDLPDIRIAVWGSVAFFSFIISLLPAIVLIFPRAYAYFWPIPVGTYMAVRILGGCLLILGNGLTLMAVLTLRGHTTFQSNGETERLITGGIFGLIRNPIVVGLGTIFLGLLLVFPSYVLLTGFILFVLNQKFRVKEEEKYLERYFGEEYLNYKATVGRHFPKIF